ncbi:AraC family transcriptional regulator [Aureimonas ureilytica]|uniref:AraC family transcriptional regulator n=1 Tax=Aureimonas ureilytica TaxID=401562 RepID=UPI003CF58FFE
MMRRMISPGFVEDALDSLRRAGIDPAPVLAELGLAFPVTAPVSNLQYGALWLRIADVLGDEFFGNGARPMRPGSFKLLCHSVLSARSLEQALRRALRFMEIVLDDPTGELHHRGGQAEIVLRTRGAPCSAFAYRTYWLILLGVLCWLIGRRIPLLQVDFACSAPENRADYHQFFGAPVRFDQPSCRLAFNASYLALPIIRDERALGPFLRAAPANILLGYRHDQSVSARVRSRLQATPLAEWPDFDRVAGDMRLSPATLRRRLRDEGQSFSLIRDELRFVLARDLLRRPGRTIADIAALLGYAEPTAFYRAFHKWSGLTPAAFRAAQGLAVGAEPKA